MKYLPLVFVWMAVVVALAAVALVFVVSGHWGMSSTAIFWITYAGGYFMWLGYALNRFCNDPGDPNECVVQIIFAFTWPICVVVYMPYRVFLALGVRHS